MTKKRLLISVLFSVIVGLCIFSVGVVNAFASEIEPSDHASAQITQPASSNDSCNLEYFYARKLFPNWDDEGHYVSKGNYFTVEGDVKERSWQFNKGDRIIVLSNRVCPKHVKIYLSGFLSGLEKDDITVSGCEGGVFQIGRIANKIVIEAEGNCIISVNHTSRPDINYYVDEIAVNEEED